MQRRNFAVITIAAAFFSGFVAHAQIANPQIVITWSAANSYAPPGYVGKVLPNQESEITASLAVISNGRAVNLNGQTIYWYQNENLMGGGIGAQKFTFRPEGTAPNTIALKIEVPDYPDGLLIHEIDIPIVQPVAVIEAPYPQGNFSGNPTVQALPYFFAATSTSPLSFSWSVNGLAVTSAENPQSLQISLPDSTPAGYAVSVTLNIQNSSDASSATANTNLTYQKQL